MCGLGLIREVRAPAGRRYPAIALVVFAALTLVSNTDGGMIAIGSSVVGKNTVPGNPLPVPEASVPAIIEALKSPAMWALARSTGEGLHTDCLLESGGFYLSVATAETGCAP